MHLANQKAKYPYMFKAKVVGTETQETLQQSESLFSIVHADFQKGKEFFLLSRPEY